MQNKRRLLSTKELAHLLNLSHRTLENMRLKERGPPYVRIGRGIRYWEHEVLSWIEQGSIRLT